MTVEHMEHVEQALRETLAHRVAAVPLPSDGVVIAYAILRLVEVQRESVIATRELTRAVKEIGG